MTARPAWSVTRVEYWKQCRYAYWLRYVVKVAPAQPVSRARAHGRLVHIGLAAAFEAARRDPTPGMMIGFRAQAHEKIMATHDRDAVITQRQRDEAWHEVASVLETIPVPGRGAIVAIEQPFAFQPGEYVIKGTIDYGARTGVDSLHLRDWKTGAIPATPEELGGNVQLAVYSAAVALWLAWLRRLTVGLYSTRTGREVITTIGNSMIEHVLGRIETIANEERLVGQSVQTGAATIAESYPTNPGDHCATCDFRSYCPLFAKADLPVRNATLVAAGKQQVADLLTRP